MLAFTIWLPMYPVPPKMRTLLSFLSICFSCNFFTKNARIHIGYYCLIYIQVGANPTSVNSFLQKYMSNSRMQINTENFLYRFDPRFYMWILLSKKNHIRIFVSFFLYQRVSLYSIDSLYTTSFTSR